MKKRLPAHYWVKATPDGKFELWYSLVMVRAYRSYRNAARAAERMARETWQ